MRYLFGLVVALALGVMGCGDDPATCPVPSGTCQYDGDNLVECDSDQVCDQAAGFVCLLDSGEPAIDGAEGLCSKPLGNGGTGGTSGTGGTAGSGGTGGTGGTAGSGGTAGTGGTAGSGGTGGTAGSGGTAGTGGSGGGSGSCFEMVIEGEPTIMGPLSISSPNASPDDTVTVTVGVDPDTRELTATIVNESSGIPGGSCFVLTGGNETVECDLRVETVADPGPHVVELELRADPLNRLDYVRYTPGDGNTYVRIKVENNVPGPETATPCLLLNCDIEFF